MIDRIVFLFDKIKPIYTIDGDGEGLFWVFENDTYVEKDRALMFISLEYFLEINYSTTLEKEKTETEIYHVVTGHAAYVGSSDFGEPVKVSLLTEKDGLFPYYAEMKLIREGGITIASDYPVDNNPDDLIEYYELELDDIFHSAMLEINSERLKEDNE